MKENKIPFEGDWGHSVFSSVVNSGGGSNYLTVDLGGAMNFFRKISLIRPRIESNILKEYSFANVGNQDIVSFGSLTLPKHLLSKRKNGCSWAPKGKMNFNSTSMSMNAVQYQGEHCPDAFWGTCMEKLMGVGNQILDVKGTAQSKAIFNEMMRNTYMGLGNSYYDLSEYGGHTMISISDTAHLYSLNTSQEDWANYIDQQEANVGIMTLVDNLKDEGIKNYKVPIYDGEYNWNSYLGQMSGKDGLFERVIRSSTQNMQAVISTNEMGAKAFFKVTPEMFLKYEDELLTSYSAIPETLYYKIHEEWAKALGLADGSALDGILKYKGHWVVRDNEQAIFDNIVGIKTHRCQLITPGVKGLAWDVRPIQFGGLGLRLYQNLNPGPDAGKVFMDSFFKMGSALVDIDFLTNASAVIVPGI